MIKQQTTTTFHLGNRMEMVSERKEFPGMDRRVYPATNGEIGSDLALIHTSSTGARIKPFRCHLPYPRTSGNTF